MNNLKAKSYQLKANQSGQARLQQLERSDCGQARLQQLERSDCGQVMLITVLALGGILLGATAIGGLLMTYQIRQSSDITNSTKAIMAADAGIEWALYCSNVTDTDNPRCTIGDVLTLSNGTKATISVTKSADPTVPFLNIKSVGNSSQIYRALSFFLLVTPPTP